MVVFSNHRLGPSVELLVSDDVAKAILWATADAARPFARARWESELVLWLEARADLFDAAPMVGRTSNNVLDVSEIAWTPDHFESQRRFLLDAIEHAAEHAEHTLAFDRWHQLIEAHPADSVQVGRRWQWQVSA